MVNRRKAHRKASVKYVAMKQLRHSPAHKGISTAVVLAVLAMLAGCASVPEVLRGGPEKGPDPTQVRTTPKQYAGMTVRWGGVIVDVENGPAQSLVQVVSRPLSTNARPLETDQTWGRFVARITGFIDPVDYAAGREITVVGVLEGTEQRNIDAYPYSYPVVRATGYYLWPLRLPPVPDPFYYSPFYSPWYPYPYPYPYR